MIRRSVGAALWTLVGLLAGFLGALSSLVGTGAGRALLARVSEGALHQVFTGTMEIGDVHGSLLTGLTLSRVRLFDADTTLVAWLPEVNVSYNPFDFAARGGGASGSTSPGWPWRARTPRCESRTRRDGCG